MTGPWLRRFGQDTGGWARLVCCPHAGGAASAYVPLARRLAPEIEVLAAQYPGRQDRRAEPRLTEIGALADRVSEAALFWSDRPLALFGHSMGALVAFEVARRLTRRSAAPLTLFVSGRRAPTVHRDDGIDLSTDAGVLALLSRLGGTDATLLADQDMVREILPVIRDDYRAVAGYRCADDATVGCPIMAVVGDADPVTEVADVDPWRQRTTGGFAMTVLPGGHFYLQDAVTELAGIVAGQLTAVAQVRRAGSGQNQ